MSGRYLWAVLLGAVVTTSAPAAAEWRLTPADVGPDVFAISGAPAPEGSPDARIAVRRGGDIVEAWYAEPTERYRHGVIGDAVEAGALLARTADGATLRLDLPESEVFEDVTPRLADLDGDGRGEIVTIRASTRAGASVSIYGLEQGELVLRGATPFIGRASRWLNIAAIAPFSRDARPADRLCRDPAHWRHAAVDRLSRRRGHGVGGSLYGFSNHAIGAFELRLSATADFDGDGQVDLALPDQSLRVLRLVRLQDAAWEDIAAIEAPARIETIVLDAGRVLARLADGRVYVLDNGR